MSVVHILRIAVLAGVAMAIWTGLAIVNARPVVQRGHAVQGILLLHGKPLPHSIVEFHRVNLPDGHVEATVTDGFGKFHFGSHHAGGVPEGEYRVVVHGRRRVERGGEVFFAPVSLPVRYSRPETTPLSTTVTGDVSALTLGIKL